MHTHTHRSIDLSIYQSLDLWTHGGLGRLLRIQNSGLRELLSRVIVVFRLLRGRVLLILIPPPCTSTQPFVEQGLQCTKPFLLGF